MAILRADHAVLWIAAGACAACGRIGFDPRQQAATVSDAASDAAPADAAPSGCAAAIAVPLATRVAASTCSGGDHLGGCGPAGTREVVFAFTPPTTAGYTVRAWDPGTNNVSQSTGVLDARCEQPTACAGVFGTTWSAGQTVYFIIEASSGGCAEIELEIDG